MKQSMMVAVLALGLLAFADNKASANGLGSAGFSIGFSFGIDHGGLYFGNVSECDPCTGKSSCHWGFLPSHLKFTGGLTANGYAVGSSGCYPNCHQGNGHGCAGGPCYGPPAVYNAYGLGAGYGLSGGYGGWYGY